MDIKDNSRLMFYVLLMCFFIKFHVSFGTDTISPNQYLSGDQTIISAGGIFELGFFKSGKSSNNYIGIWFKKGSEQTIVWVANREKPIYDRYSSVLKISDSNLVLFNESRIPIWSTNLSLTTSSSVEAVLVDEGNLVLKNLSDNSSNRLWQSFDYPTHTWLPGMKIGFNKRTKVNRRLVSWKNKEDPSPGIFSFELDPSGSNQYLMLWNGSERYWYSGEWNGGTFKFTPNVTYLQNTYPFKVYFVSNENETYFMYSVKNPKFIIGLIMGASGQMKQMFGLKASKTWFQFWLTPAQACKVYANCGAFSICSEHTQPLCACLAGFKQNSEQDWNLQDYSGGCVRKTQLQCVNNSLTNGKSDQFLANANMLLPNPQSVPVRSIEGCEKTCLNDCSCTAYAYEKDECSIWVGNLLNLQKLAKGDRKGKTVYIKLADSEFSSANDNINKGTVSGGVVGSIVASLVILSFIMFVFLRKRKRTIRAEEGHLVAFAYKDLQKATKNFSERLGKGGFGSVFKGVLPNSRFIAVKKLESLSQGEKEFRTEVRTIGNIQHVNLVQLHGFCTQGNRKLLVYEYMPNGSLNSRLFHEKESRILDWETRYKIALGTARGLAYLHEECRDCIIHCDIKPENILLDAEFCPKVADFGLAKLHGREFSRVLTTIRGTRGLKSIMQIELYDNQLSCELPESLVNLTTLLNFDVSQNNLTGNLSQNIASMSFKSLNLNDNHFTGKIPETLALNPNMVQLKLFNNSFGQKLPENLGKFSDLEDFDVSTNDFTIELPQFLCYRSRLQNIIIFKNRFSGKIPESYGECKARNLTHLLFSGNNFIGQIPSVVCNLHQLEVIDMSKNRFSGEMPSCVTQLNNLEKLDLQLIVAFGFDNQLIVSSLSGNPALSAARI
ncbi:hypothetical protein LWI28_024146 [Acer negundo]|uniref:non-specific serine/threonine protein kinase n=1 Tax=Acer negundo TaxID=4023 RepID=A0AAD5IJD5_ACENE|nr:hypothetical protein LWI28_024146 [Acer negundo]